MYITIFELNHKDKRTANSIMNRHEMHRDIQSLFGDNRENAKNIYRIVERNGKIMLYIYSEKPVDKASAHFGMKFIGEGTLPEHKKGERAYIDMLVTPIKTILCEYDGKKRKRPIFNSEERIEWCRKKAIENGFHIDNIAEVKKETLKIDKHNGMKPWVLDAYEYKLEAVISDPDKFTECMINGFGRNGSYGAGLLVVTSQV